ncbi:MAG: hypothetical protein WCO78_00855 [Candidatus Roizmanbacteria bacterium]
MPTPVWGKIDPPKYADISFGDFLKWGLQVFFVVLALFALYNMLMGAFGWVSSNGVEEKIQAARDQIMHALIGLILAIFVLVIWGVLASNMLGIVQTTSSGQWLLCLPTINGNTCPTKVN